MGIKVNDIVSKSPERIALQNSLAYGAMRDVAIRLVAYGTILDVSRRSDADRLSIAVSRLTEEIERFIVLTTTELTDD